MRRGGGAWFEATDRPIALSLEHACSVTNMWHLLVFLGLVSVDGIGFLPLLFLTLLLHLRKLVIKPEYRVTS